MMIRHDERQETKMRAEFHDDDDRPIQETISGSENPSKFKEHRTEARIDEDWDTHHHIHPSHRTHTMCRPVLQTDPAELMLACHTLHMITALRFLNASMTSARKERTVIMWWCDVMIRDQRWMRTWEDWNARGEAKMNNDAWMREWGDDGMMKWGQRGWWGRWKGRDPHRRQTQNQRWRTGETEAEASKKKWKDEATKYHIISHHVALHASIL